MTKSLRASRPLKVRVRVFRFWHSVMRCPRCDRTRVNNGDDVVGRFCRLLTHRRHGSMLGNRVSKNWLSPWPCLGLPCLEQGKASQGARSHFRNLPENSRLDSDISVLNSNGLIARART
jgi:hypothetical protein